MLHWCSYKPKAKRHVQPKAVASCYPRVKTGLITKNNHFLTSQNRRNVAERMLQSGPNDNICMQSCEAETMGLDWLKSDKILGFLII